MLWRWAQAATEPLPDEGELGNEEYRAELSGHRDKRWEQLDAGGREAWSVWAAVADQVAPLVPDSKESPMRLDLGAVRWSMDAHGVKLSRQLALWGLVKMLHDIRWHRDRTLLGYCQSHSWSDDGEQPWDFGCKRCRITLEVDDAAGS